MDDWEDPDERLKAEVIRGLGRDAEKAEVTVTRTAGARVIKISGLEPLNGPTCKKCGTGLIIAAVKRKRWWHRRIKRVCPTCDPDHPISISARNVSQELGE